MSSQFSLLVSSSLVISGGTSLPPFLPLSLPLPPSLPPSLKQSAAVERADDEVLIHFASTSYMMRTHSNEPKCRLTSSCSLLFMRATSRVGARGVIMLSGVNVLTSLARPELGSDREETKSLYL